jgi:hypothetical protein
LHLRGVYLECDNSAIRVASRSSTSTISIKVSDAKFSIVDIINCTYICAQRSGLKSLLGVKQTQSYRAFTGDFNDICPDISNGIDIRYGYFVGRTGGNTPCSTGLFFSFNIGDGAAFQFALSYDNQILYHRVKWNGTFTAWA